MHVTRVLKECGLAASIFPSELTIFQFHSERLLLEITKFMHMFSSPMQAVEFESNLHKNVDEMLRTLSGCDYQTAIRIIDWMKDAVTASAAVTFEGINAFSSAECPSFPFNRLKIGDYCQSV